MAFLFDNKATVAYAAIVTVWSALFLPAWDVSEYQFQVKIIDKKLLLTLFFSFSMNGIHLI
jgi:hypothetical protein